MLYPRVPCLFVVSLALSLAPGVALGQGGYKEKDLLAELEAYKLSEEGTGCNPMVDPGCHIPLPDPNGPDGCSDCNPNDLLKALIKENEVVLPDELIVKDQKVIFLEENKKYDSIFNFSDGLNQ